MPSPRRLELIADPPPPLVAAPHTRSPPYQRERAGALVKIADGACAAEVARTGLLRPRQPDTVYRWLDRYQAEGIAGLRIRPGRGRKPAFSPCAPER